MCANIELLLEIRELEAMGLNSEEVLGSMDIIFENNPTYIESEAVLGIKEIVN